MIQIDQNSFDWQGHRGCRGHYPENSIPAFLHALSTPVTTLEMDAAISKEGLVIISHEPWFNPSICRGPQGEQEGLEKVAIHDLTYDQIKQYDCGSWGNPRFPDQHALKTYKPSLEDVIHAVRAYCADNQRPFPSFNIEIKSQPEWDGIFTPAVDSFADTLVAACRALDILSVTTIQSFDLRALKVVHDHDPEVTLSLLVEEDFDLDSLLDELGFVPLIISPYYRLLTPEIVQACHRRQMLVLPWTVNELDDMRKMKAMGVDGLITDYVDRIEQIR
ncbi:MAG: glycerophosphodiester phosphodiesterase family protein [Saprospiraceae bacterium]